MIITLHFNIGNIILPKSNNIIYLLYSYIYIHLQYSRCELSIIPYIPVNYYVCIYASAESLTSKTMSGIDHKPFLTSVCFQ